MSEDKLTTNKETKDYKETKKFKKSPGQGAIQLKDGVAFNIKVSKEDNYCNVKIRVAVENKPSAEKTKKHAVLILDNSVSMRENNAFEILKTAIKDFVAKKMPENALVSIILFNKTADTVVKRKKPKELKGKLDRLGTVTGTSITSAVQALDPSLCRHDEQTYVLFFSDGMHNHPLPYTVSDDSELASIVKQWIKEALKSREQAFQEKGLIFPSISCYGFNKPIAEYLETLASDGSFTYAKNVESLKNAIDGFADFCLHDVAKVGLNYKVTTPTPFLLHPTPISGQASANSPFTTTFKVPIDYLNKGDLTITINDKNYKIQGSKLLKAMNQQEENQSSLALISAWNVELNQIAKLPVREQLSRYTELLEKIEEEERRNKELAKYPTEFEPIKNEIKKFRAAISKEEITRLEVQSYFSMLPQPFLSGQGVREVQNLIEGSNLTAEFGISINPEENTLTSQFYPPSGTHVIINRGIDLVKLFRANRSAVWISGVGPRQSILAIIPSDMARLTTDPNGFQEIIEAVNKFVPNTALRVTSSPSDEIRFEQLLKPLYTSGWTCREKNSRVACEVAAWAAESKDTTREVYLRRFSADNLRAHAFVIVKEGDKVYLLDATNHPGSQVFELSNPEQRQAAFNYYQSQRSPKLPGLLRDLCVELGYPHPLAEELFFDPNLYPLTEQQLRYAKRMGWTCPLSKQLMTKPVILQDGLGRYFCDETSLILFNNVKGRNDINPFTEKAYNSNYQIIKNTAIAGSMLAHFKAWFPSEEQELTSTTKNEEAKELKGPKQTEAPAKSGTVSLCRPSQRFFGELSEVERKALQAQNLKLKNQLFLSKTALITSTVIICPTIVFTVMYYHNHVTESSNRLTDFLEKHTQAFEVLAIMALVVLATIMVVNSRKLSAAKKSLSENLTKLDSANSGEEEELDIPAAPAA